MKNLAELLASLRQPHHDTENAAAEPAACLACAAALAGEPEYEEFRVCPSCRFHYNVGARRRVGLLVDSGTFREMDRSYIALDPISFSRAYRRRVIEEQRRTGLADAIVTGHARIGGQRTVLAVIDFRFLGGTIGSVVGEKLARAFESAARRRRPLVVVVAGGGARLQEGPLALAQLAKLAAAQRRLSAARVPFISVLANPTTGAAYAGFASLADYIVAEPGALVGYATMRAARAASGGRMPLDAHTAESHLHDGMIDAVVDRTKLRELLSTLLGLFAARSRVKARGDEDDGAAPAMEGGAWQEVQLSRHAQRPTARDYIGRITSRFVELRGDRVTGDDPAVVCGIGEIGGEAVMFAGQQHEPVEGGGIPEAGLRPEGFRKARRAMQLAARFEMPLVTLVDTPGAAFNAEAEARGIGHAIANCTATLADLPTPTIAAVIGEADSEAALAFSVADRVLMLEHATFSVTSPERAAELLFRDASKTEEAASALHLTARECKQLKVVDVIVAEPADGAHTDHEGAARRLGAAIVRALAEIQKTPVRRLTEQRTRKYRALGGQSGYITAAVAQEFGELRDALGRRAGSAVARIRRRGESRPPMEDAEPVLIP
jgi:acetyl-CoA carboxylase carboxyl transferase alpha subunit/acetyl-CoA carboxylase carboxyl transferase beta subunit